ncbi:MAG: HEPN domain-containing protein [archaeon]
MVGLKWCCKQKEGIKLINPNENLAKGYIEMAEKAIGTMCREKNFNMQFAISACYYSMYYSLYSVLMKIGIKCEIHSCTLEIMKTLLKDFYSKEDFKLINKAFDVRNTAQYYVDKIIEKGDIEFIMANAPPFLSKPRSILAKINEKDITGIKNEIKKLQINP